MANHLPLSRRFFGIQFLFFGISCLLVGGVACLPLNREWLSDTVGRFHRQWRQLGGHDAVGFRWRQGGGMAYAYAEIIRKHTKPGDYFLIPPQRYLLDRAYSPKQPDEIFAWVYPSVMYYYARGHYGLLEMHQSPALLNRATHTFLVQQGRLRLVPLTAQNRDSVLTQFRQYDPQFCCYTPEQAAPYLPKR